MGRIDGKSAVMEDGGGPNIGRLISTLLASDGATVVVIVKDVEAGEHTCDRIDTKRWNRPIHTM